MSVETESEKAEREALEAKAEDDRLLVAEAKGISNAIAKIRAMHKNPKGDRPIMKGHVAIGSKEYPDKYVVVFNNGHKYSVQK